jgi:hypothetical protein
MFIGEWAITAAPSASASPSTNGNPSSSASTGSGAYSSSLSITLESPSDLGPAHIGVISHGKFTPLRLPPGFTPVAAGGIAW